MIRSNRMQRAISAQSLSGWQYANPLRMLRSLWHHRSLIRQITRREIILEQNVLMAKNLSVFF